MTTKPNLINRSFRSKSFSVRQSKHYMQSKEKTQVNEATTKNNDAREIMSQ